MISGVMGFLVGTGVKLDDPPNVFIALSLRNGSPSPKWGATGTRKVLTVPLAPSYQAVPLHGGQVLVDNHYFGLNP